MSKKEDFDQFVDDFQAEIDAKDRQDFSAYALELARNPYNYGSLNPDKNVYSLAWQGPCGDTMKIYVKIQDELIIDASYEVDGCATSIMAGSQTMKMIKGKSLREVKKLEDKDVLAALGKFPTESHHCCTLAITTLKKTLELYSNQQ